ncbi:hypothetical protein [Nocardia sp. NPDC024068]|uniref:hypothetical protein n=1 Tax=Nocardia sp. NPDC024068 TaxID=3157197 RepID=UPI0033C0B985
MNGITNRGTRAVALNTRLSAASRGFLAMQGTGRSCTDGFGAQPRIRRSNLNVIEPQDQSFAIWHPAAAPVAAGPLAIDPVAAYEAADKRAEGLRKGHPATVNRRPQSRPR